MKSRVGQEGPDDVGRSGVEPAEPKRRRVRGGEKGGKAGGRAGKLKKPKKGKAAAADDDWIPAQEPVMIIGPN